MAQPPPKDRRDGELPLTLSAAPTQLLTPQLELRAAASTRPTQPNRGDTRFVVITIVALGLGLAGLGAQVALQRARAPRVDVATAKARAFRDTAFTHFRAGRFAETVTALEAGHAARPHPAFLLDLALAHAAWDGHCPQALRALRAFHDACPSCPTRTAEAARIDALYASCAVDVMIDSTPMGATIRVDGEVEGTTPSLLHVTPGEHDVTLELEGHQKLELSKVPMERSAQRHSFTFELKKAAE